MLAEKIKKMLFTGLIICGAMVLFLPHHGITTTFAETKTDTINILIKNQTVEFTNETGIPFINKANRTLVPMRVVMEKYGCTVDWNQENRTAIVKKGEVTVEVPVGKDYVTVNGKQVKSDSAAQVVKGRTYLPIAVVLEAVGADVRWDNSIKTVLVDSMPAPSQNFEDFAKEFELIDSRVIEGYNQYGVVAQSRNLSSSQLSHYLSALDHKVFFKYSHQLVEKEKFPDKYMIHLYFVSKDFNLEKDYKNGEKSAYMVAHIGNAAADNGKLKEFLTASFYDYQKGKRH